MVKGISKLFLILICIAAVSPANAVTLPDTSGTISPDLQQVLNTSSKTAQIDIIIEFSDHVDYIKTKEKGKKNRSRLIESAKSKSNFSQQKLIDFLTRRNIVNYKKLWMINALAVTVEAQLVPKIVIRLGVLTIRLDKKITINAVNPGVAATARWNLNKINVNTAWLAGFTGQTIVVGVLDTGVDLRHPDLQPRFRGGSNSWLDPYFDPAGTRANSPYDLQGHGTAVTGIIVGGNSSGTDIGVAPGAKWIAAKIFDDNRNASISAIHAAFQWMLDPDNNPLTDDAADIVNNSWNFGSPNICDYEFQMDIDALRAADISVIFSSGNTGSGANTSLSPANNANTISTGAVDELLNIKNFSSRGPTLCGTGYYPNIVAPGDNIYTATLVIAGSTAPLYKPQSGTSFAAPHISGALAILQSAFPNSTSLERENAIRISAQPLGSAGDDDIYGWGLLDIAGAYQTLLSGLPPYTAAPTAFNDTLPLTEDAVATTIDILINDKPDATSVDASNILDQTSVVIVSKPNPNIASITVDPTSGMVTYSVLPDAFGTDSFSYRVADKFNNPSNTATVGITITAVNDLPVAKDDTYSALSGTILNIPAQGIPVNGVTISGLLANDTDVDNTVLTAILDPTNTPLTGKLILNADGSFSYDYSGIDNITEKFRYFSNDGTANSALPATVTLNITGASNSPVASNATIIIKEDALAIAFDQAIKAVVDQTKDANNRIALNSVVIVTPPSPLIADVVVDKLTGIMTYSLVKDAFGSDSFRYTVTDSYGNISNIATIKLTVTPVNDLPIAKNDFYSGSSGQVLNVAANGTIVKGVLANDTDVDNNKLSAVLDPSNATLKGELKFQSDGSFIYTYNGAAAITETFRYFSNDGTANSQAASTVTIEILAASQAPVAKPDSLIINEDAPGVDINIVKNDTVDVQINANNKIDLMSIIIVSGPNETLGKINVKANTGLITYTPVLNANGKDSFSYTIKDTLGNMSNVAIVDITINSINDLPIANNESYVAYSGVTLDVPVAGVLKNDSDVDNTSLMAVYDTNSTITGTLTFLPDGSFTYRYDGIDSITETFRYFTNDGTANSQSPATVTINVAGKTAAPKAIADTFTINEDAAVIEIDVIQNDVQSTSLGKLISFDLTSVTIISPPSAVKGVASVNPQTGKISYTALRDANGIDSFSYQIADLDGTQSNTAIVEITIKPINDLPIAVNDEFTGQLGAQLIITSEMSVLLNDTDVDGDSLTAQLDPSNSALIGELVFNNDGSFTYMYTGSKAITETFQYFTKDNSGKSILAATVTLYMGTKASTDVENNSSSGGGGGCSLQAQAEFDPIFPLILLLFSLLFLVRRKR